MAHIMVCDDDDVSNACLRSALEAAGHTTIACRHTMDVLRAAADGAFDLVAFSLDAPGFSSTNAALALRQLAPHLPLIAFHHDPAQLVGTPQHALLYSALRRPVSTTEFIRTVTAALADRRLHATRDHHPAAPRTNF